MVQALSSDFEDNHCGTVRGATHTCTPRAPKWHTQSTAHHHYPSCTHCKGAPQATRTSRESSAGASMAGSMQHGAVEVRLSSSATKGTSTVPRCMLPLMVRLTACHTGHQQYQRQLRPAARNQTSRAVSTDQQPRLDQLPRLVNKDPQHKADCKQAYGWQQAAWPSGHQAHGVQTTT
jgi:hypothetical protein